MIYEILPIIFALIAFCGGLSAVIYSSNPIADHLLYQQHSKKKFYFYLLMQLIGWVLVLGSVIPIVIGMH